MTTRVLQRIIVRISTFPLEALFASRMIYENIIAFLVLCKRVMTRAIFINKVLRSKQWAVKFCPRHNIKQVRIFVRFQRTYTILRSCSRSGKTYKNLSVVFQHRRSLIYCITYFFPIVFRRGEQHRFCNNFPRLRRIDLCHIKAGNFHLIVLRPNHIMLSASLKICHVQRKTGKRKIISFCFLELPFFCPISGIRIPAVTHQHIAVKCPIVFRITASRIKNIPCSTDVMQLRCPDKTVCMGLFVRLPDCNLLCLTKSIHRL